VPKVLVGLKLDLRDDEKTITELKKVNQKPVTFEEGQAMSTQINAYKYLECSAKSRNGVKEVQNRRHGLRCKTNIFFFATIRSLRQQREQH